MYKFSVLVAGFLLLNLVACSSLQDWAIGQKPEAKLKEVFIKEADMTGALLVFVVNVQNPNKHDLKIDEIAYRVFLDGKEVSQAKTEKNILVKAEQETEVPIPLPVKYSQIFDNMAAALTAGSITYKIEGDAKVSPFSIPFSKSGKVDLN